MTIGTATDQAREIARLEKIIREGMESHFRVSLRAEQAEQERDRLAARVAELEGARDALLADRAAVALEHQEALAVRAEELRRVCAERDEALRLVRYAAGRARGR